MPSPTSPPNDDRTEVLRQSCEEAFRAIEAGLEEHVVFSRPLASLDFQVELDASFNALVRSFRGSRSAQIEINDGLLAELYETLDMNAEALMVAVLWPLAEGEEPPFLPLQSVLETVFELAVHFVLHHELFHVLGGHLDLDDVTTLSAGARVLDERLDLARRQGGPAPLETHLRSYFLELEADASAIEWMLDSVSFSRLETSLRALGWHSDYEAEVASTLFTLTGPSRILGFRFLVTAVWIVIALMESNRSGIDHRHPLPAARLINAIKTLMLCYCGGGRLRFLDHGEVRWEPPEGGLESIAEFWRGVMKPVVMQLQDFPDADTARELALPAGDTGRDNATALLEDIHDLIANRPPKGLGAQQLNQVSALRYEMTQELATFRYLDIFTPLAPGIEDFGDR